MTFSLRTNDTAFHSYYEWSILKKYIINEAAPFLIFNARLMFNTARVEEKG